METDKNKMKKYKHKLRKRHFKKAIKFINVDLAVKSIMNKMVVISIEIIRNERHLYALNEENSYFVNNRKKIISKLYKKLRECMLTLQAIEMTVFNDSVAFSKKIDEESKNLDFQNVKYSDIQRAKKIISNALTGKKKFVYDEKIEIYQILETELQTDIDAFISDIADSANSIEESKELITEILDDNVNDLRKKISDARCTLSMLKQSLHIDRQTFDKLVKNAVNSQSSSEFVKSTLNEIIQ